MKYFLTMICAAILLISCDSDDECINTEIKEPAIYPKAERTVIVYISAENNLSPFATSDINEMARGSIMMPANTNLIAFVDKNDKNKPPYILRMRNGEMETDTYYNNDTDFYASDPERMYETLHWIMTRYPAETYGLVLWGHASGWVIEKDSISPSPAMNKPQRAYVVDYGTDNITGNGAKWMNIPSMAGALGRLPHRLLFIFADCCNFQNAEVAYELRNVTDYIIASPAEIPNVGAPYDKVVPDMFDTSDDFYKKMVDDYHSMKTNAGEQVPLSVVKTSGMEALAKATQELTALLGQAGKYPYTENLIYYRHTKKYGDVKLMLDMNDIMLRNISEEVYGRWKTVYDRTVIYKAMSKKWMTDGLVDFDFDMNEEKFGGMSMFVPLEIYDKKGYDFCETIQKMTWYYAAGVDKCYTGSIKN